MTIHLRISEAADPLHFGVWGEVQGNTGKLASKILYFLFGIFLTGLCITGTYMYGLRVGRKVGSIPSKNTPRANTPFGIWRVALKKMGWVAWFFISAVVVCLGYGTYTYIPFRI